MYHRSQRVGPDVGDGWGEHVVGDGAEVRSGTGSAGGAGQRAGVGEGHQLRRVGGPRRDYRGPAADPPVRNRVANIFLWLSAKLQLETGLPIFSNDYRRPAAYPPIRNRVANIFLGLSAKLRLKTWFPIFPMIQNENHNFKQSNQDLQFLSPITLLAIIIKIIWIISQQLKKTP